MRLALSNDEWLYVQQDNVKLVEIDGDIHIVGLRNPSSINALSFFVTVFGILN